MKKMTMFVCLTVLGLTGCGQNADKTKRSDISNDQAVSSSDSDVAVYRAQNNKQVFNCGTNSKNKTIKNKKIKKDVKVGRFGCSIQGSTISGKITMGENSSLNLSNSQVSKQIKSTGGKGIVIKNSRIQSLSVTKQKSGNIVIEKSDVNSPIKISSSEFNSLILKKVNKKRKDNKATLVVNNVKLKANLVIKDTRLKGFQLINSEARLLEGDFVSVRGSVLLKYSEIDRLIWGATEIYGSFTMDSNATFLETELEYVYFPGNGNFVIKDNFLSGVDFSFIGDEGERLGEWPKKVLFSDNYFSDDFSLTYFETPVFTFNDNSASESALGEAYGSEIFNLIECKNNDTVDFSELDYNIYGQDNCDS